MDSIQLSLNRDGEISLLGELPLPPPELPPDPPGELPDPRTYYRQWTPGSGTGSDGENPIAPYTHGGQTSSYAKAVASTPGLSHWWRFDQALGAVNGAPPLAPYWANSCGATTFRSLGHATKRVPGLIPSEVGGFACDLDGGSLSAFDYRVIPTTLEVMSAEIWVYFRSLRDDVNIMGAWGGGAGWMIYESNSDLLIYAGAGHLTARNVLTPGLHHIVGVWGGQQAPHGDYKTRLYVDGQCVLSGELVTPPINNDNVWFEIGRYSNNRGANTIDGIVDEPAVYSRMLQPEEVAQHYAVGMNGAP